MTTEQLSQAWSLLGVPGIRVLLADLPYLGVDVLETRTLWQETRRITVPNLADKTGAVEGALHRVLEGLAGEEVEIVICDDGWRAARVVTWPKDLTACGYPTRLDAIVAALVEWR